MVMMERFGSPATRLMSVMKNFQVPGSVGSAGRSGFDHYR